MFNEYVLDCIVRTRAYEGGGDMSKNAFWASKVIVCDVALLARMDKLFIFGFLQANKGNWWTD